MNKLNNQQQILPFDFNQSLGFREQVQQQTKLIIRIDEDIKEVAYYGNVIERMNELTENDVVEIILNTNGGHLDSTLAIVNAINNCKADVIGIIEGMAASGGSLIALACPSLAVSPYSVMMLHSASGIDGGKLHEHQASFSFNHRWISKVLRDSYEGFLTDSEITSMLDGKDFYFDADEVMNRLEQRSKYFEKKQKESERLAEKEAKALQIADNMSKKLAPKTKPKKEDVPAIQESNISV